MWMERVAAIHASPVPPRPVRKGFVPSVPGIPILEDYGVEQGEAFWSLFPSNRNLRGGSPFKLRVEEFRRIGALADLSSPDMVLMEEVLRDVTDGADLRVREDYVPTRSPNSRSAIVDGKWVTDEVAKGVRDKIFAGPFDSCPKKATVNSLQTAPKPNGKVRIILNFSAPKKRGVNQSIDKKAYPAEMGGMKEILRALNFCGPGALFFKCDFVSAYKHIHVQQKQLRYQWFSWLGKFFVELCLVFGCVSSVGIYDRMARLIIRMAVSLSKFPAFLAVQHLDDLCVISPRDGMMIKRLYEHYMEICEKVGVSLQEADNVGLDKAFAPTTKGVMLGIWFCTESWTWWLSQDKIARYANDLLELSQMNETTQRMVWQSVGKVLYVSVLLPGSQYHTSAMMAANNQSKDPNALVGISGLMREQLLWWVDMIRLVGDGMPIPAAYDVCPLTAVQADSDAAGGTLRGGSGCGVLFRKAWSQVLWPHFMNTGAKCICGSQWKHKLSFMEFVGHFLHIVVFAEENVGKVIRTNIDNSGSVILARKGRSARCPIMDTLIRAANYVAVALRCCAYDVEVTRCESVGAKGADALSKSDFKRFLALVPDCEGTPRWVPVSFLKWLAKPTQDGRLGLKVVKELQKRGVDVVPAMANIT